MKASRIVCRIALTGVALGAAWMVWSGVSHWCRQSGTIDFPKIDRHPPALVREVRSLGAVPRFDPDSPNPFHVDVRSRDLSALDLTASSRDLLGASFDTATRWPTAERMPAGFDPARIIELGRNPGLGVRRLHRQGITGRGVGIAVIDQILPVDHPEYAERLRLYEEAGDIDWPLNQVDMHGAAVASIAVGKTIGVAPEADLYYVATLYDMRSLASQWRQLTSGGRSRPAHDFRVLARCVRRVLQINSQLPADRKIRVLAMAIGWRSDSIGFDEITTATEEARAAGLLVICSSILQVHGLKFHGLGREPLADPDAFESWTPGLFWAREFWGNAAVVEDCLLVPMDARTIAGYTREADFAFTRVGGWSWSIPYIAGLYALAAQVKPDVTPESFWTYALETGRTTQIQREGRSVPFGRIVDPVALIERVQAQ